MTPEKESKLRSLLLIFFLISAVGGLKNDASADEAEAERLLSSKNAEQNHITASIVLLVFIVLMILIILTIWVIKHFRLRYIHETGLSIIYGLLMGLILKYAYAPSNQMAPYNMTLPETANDTILPENFKGNFSLANNTVVVDSAVYRCEITHNNVYENGVNFDPEIFFYVILPPIIFNAGYSMKRRHFFRNFGAILTYAFIGTLISAFSIGGMLYGAAQAIPGLNATSPTNTKLTFANSLYFGSVISATDPVTVLAIFHDLNVDVDLYALVFGESVLNDAVAIVLSQSVENFQTKQEADPDYNVGVGVLESIGLFLGKFFGAFLIGFVIACINALMTKFTKIRDYPLMESSLFVLMSYISYLCAEAAQMSGIVSVLFCGIFQAHYTFNNLSDGSKKRTKELMELLNFITENFVFLYIGISVFTSDFKAKDVNVPFAFAALIAMTISRALNVYPLSALLNCGRKNKIPFNFQHMMMFSGLRGAIAFALVIRKARTSMLTIDDILLTTTIFLVGLTVIGCGALTLTMLTKLKINVGVDDHTIEPTVEQAALNLTSRETTTTPAVTTNDKTGVAFAWNRLDNLLLKPILTHYRYTLSDNYPQNRCCGLISRCFTTTEQLMKSAGRSANANMDNDSDVDIIIDDDELNEISQSPNSRIFSIDTDPGDLGVTPLTGKAQPRLEFNI